MLFKTVPDLIGNPATLVLGECGRPKKAMLSSQNDHLDHKGIPFPGEKCIDGIETGGQTSLCHTNKEDYPFLVLEYDDPVEVSEVIVYNRDDGWGDRLKNLTVIVTDQYPEVGKPAEGMLDLSIYSICCKHLII